MSPVHLHGECLPRTRSARRRRTRRLRLGILLMLALTRKHDPRDVAEIFRAY